MQPVMHSTVQPSQVSSLEGAHNLPKSEASTVQGPVSRQEVTSNQNLGATSGSRIKVNLSQQDYDGFAANQGMDEDQQHMIPAKPMLAN